MQRETSIYLDLLRFSAAFVVLVVHASGGGITGGVLWQLGAYGQTAVMAFFVLSGYVIGFVSNNKERKPFDFLIARVSRLYSVILPAILITWLCNEFGGLLIKEEYAGPWNDGEKMEYFRYFISLLMLQDVWGIKLSPTNNGPFWSITFETFYYAFFGVVFYLRSKLRFIILAVLFCIAGPTIVLLFPLWLLGYFANSVHRNGGLASYPVLAFLGFVASASILVFSPQYRSHFDFASPVIDRESIVGDYLDGIAVFLHLLVVPVVAGRAGFILLLIRKPLTFVASLTFSLYLFHQPLVRVFAGMSPFIADPGSIANVAFVYLATFAVILLVGVPAERSKKILANYLNVVVDRYQLRNGLSGRL